MYFSNSCQFFFFNPSFGFKFSPSLSSLLWRPPLLGPLLVPPSCSCSCCCCCCCCWRRAIFFIWGTRHNVSVKFLWVSSVRLNISLRNKSNLGPLVLKPHLHDSHCQPSLSSQRLSHLQVRIDFFKLYVSRWLYIILTKNQQWTLN